MLRVTTDDDLDALADALAGVLARPMTDPMAPEWIVVVSAGMQRWLRLGLARRLGTAGDGATDGVAANLDLLFPGRLTRRVLHADGDDPWDLDHLVWAVLEVLEGHGDDLRLGPLTRPAPGVTRWGRARRLADLLDRYLLHRPGMVRAWAAGHDRDEAGRPLPAPDAWQAHLFRLVRDRIGQPSPPELLPARLEALRRGDRPVDVPERISLFGLSTIPGGAPFLDVLDALGTQRDVHLLLHQPSRTLSDRVRAARHEVAAATRWADGHPVLLRSEDPTRDEAVHPLLRTWARPAREAAVLLGDRLPAPPTTAPAAADGRGPAPTTLLEQLQADLRADRAPSGGLVPADHDRSIVIHSCHGATRQVEVLRDQLLHLLAEDPTLDEEDIVVLCPALDEFAPLLEAVLGPSAGEGTGPDTDAGGPPALSYRIADRSLGSAYPLLRALGALVELLASRCSDAAVLDLLDLGPVRERYGFSDADVERLADWVDDADVRWGLDGPHRQRWGIPADHAAGTWRHAVDRLLVGVAVTDHPDALGPAGLLPLDLEGSDAALAGRLADLLGRIAELHEATRVPRPAAAWVDLLGRAADDLFDVAPEAAWQRHRLRRLLADIGAAATLPDGPSTVLLDLDDVRHLLGRHLQGPTGRTSFFRGGITVSSLTPLRGLPHRVVCLLGMDEAAFSAGAPDGDDLTAADPLVGDRDRRADLRQGLLETVQAARDHLVVLRSGHSVVTNQPVPPAVVVAELREVVARTVAEDVRDDVLARLEVEHPRQRFDERNFLPGGASGSLPSADGPWGFDPLALRGASARRRGDGGDLRFLSEPLPAATPDTPPGGVLELADLADVVVNPSRHFLRRVLEVELPRTPAGRSTPLVAAPASSGLPRPAEGRDLALELDGLERWQVADRYLAHRRRGGDVDAFRRRQLAGDGLPPGRLADAELDEAAATVEPLLARLAELGADQGPEVPVPIDVLLPDGTRIVGSVLDAGGHRPGPIRASASTPAHAQQLVPWLELLALTAQDPSTDWAAVLVHRPSGKTKKGYHERVLEIPVDDPEQRRQRALAALDVVVDLHRRARREPLPIFPKLSPALDRGTSARSAWTTDGWGRGDDADPYLRVAFDHASVEDITSLPVRADDPPGEATDRARRWATHLWDAVRASMAPTDDDGDADLGAAPA